MANVRRAAWSLARPRVPRPAVAVGRSSPLAESCLPRRASASSPASRHPGAFVRRHPVALAVTVLALAGAVAPLASVRSPLDGAAVPGATLALPLGYVVLSPLSRLLDALCLLAGPQHAALGVTLLLAWTAWRVAAARRTTRARARVGVRPVGWGAALWRETRAALLGLVALVAVYALATLAPRPMAALAVADPALVRVDVHAHTHHSHDVPAWFDVAARRAWSRRGGYDAVFVTDHRAFRGWQEARAGNPRLAGEGVSLLPGLEARLLDIHILVLGLAAADTGLIPDDHIERTLPRYARWEPGAAPGTGRWRLPSGGRPVVIATIPDPVFQILTPWARDSFAVRAVEVVDGAPRGLAQADRDGRALRTSAATLGIAPVTASNHHGWGSAAVTWTLMRVPGWRTLSPDALEGRLLALFDSAGANATSGAVVPVVRARPRLADAAAAPTARVLSAAVTVPALAWQTTRELTPAERVVWLGWAWGLAGLAAVVRRRP